MTKKESLEQIKTNNDKIDFLESQICELERENKMLTQIISRLVLEDVTARDNIKIVNLYFNSDSLNELYTYIDKFMLENENVKSLNILQKGCIIFLTGKDEEDMPLSKIAFNFNGASLEAMNEIGNIIYENVIYKIADLKDCKLSYDCIEDEKIFTK